MVVFSKPLDPVDEFSHQMDAETHLAADIDGTIDEREQLEESLDGNDGDGPADIIEASNDPRDMVMGELTLRLSNTFRLEEKVIETVSAVEKPSQDEETEKETPATSSSNSSCGGASQDSQSNGEEPNHIHPLDETTPDNDDQSAPSPLTAECSDPDEVLPSSALEDEEEKKDDSHDAQMLLCRQETEVQQEAEEEIERIVPSPQDEVTDDEADIPMRSNINREQHVQHEATPESPLNIIESQSSSGTEENDDNSLSGFTSAKGDMSAPPTPDRSRHELAADLEHPATTNDVIESPNAGIQITEIQIASEERPDDDKGELMDEELLHDKESIGVSPVSVTTTLDRVDPLVERRTDTEVGGGDACRAGLAGLDMDASESEPSHVDDGASKTFPSSAQSPPMETHEEEENDSLPDEDSVKPLVINVADELPEPASNPSREEADLRGESTEVTLRAASHDEWIDISSPGSKQITGKDLLSERIGPLNGGLEPENSSQVAAIMEEVASCSQSNIELSSCYSDDSGVLDSHSVDYSGEMVRHSPNKKKKKGLLGKLKKRLTRKEGHAMKDCASSECEMSITSSSSMRDTNSKASKGSEAFHESPILGLETPSERHIEAFNGVPHPSEPTFSPAVNSTPTLLFVGGEKLPDSTIVASSGCPNSSDLPERRPVERELPSQARRRQAVQASNEVAHVFRPPRQSPAALSPIYSGTSSPNPSQMSTPASGQFSMSDMHQSNSEHTRPHLPTLSTPRESFSLPPQPPRKESATRQMTRLIRKDLWSTDPAHVESALLHLTEIAHDPEKVTLIARTGGILAIINCMEQHTMHADIQIAACNALEKLALDAENELAIGEVGGVEAIQGAMMTHFGDTRVQEAAWAALWNLSCGNADCGSLNHAGLVACMTRHSDHAQVQRNACGTLANLCLDDEDRMTALAHAGGFVAIASALEKFWREEDVKNEAAHALVQLLGPAAETYDLPANHTHHPQPHE